MAVYNEPKLFLSSIILVLILNLGVIECCSGGSSDETATKSPDPNGSSDETTTKSPDPNATSSSMPSFKNITCEEDYGNDKCIEVTFPNSKTDVLELKRPNPNQAIYEGYLRDEGEAVMMTEVPMSRKRSMTFNSVNFPGCHVFDTYLETNMVKCVKAGFNDTVPNQTSMRAGLEGYHRSQVVNPGPIVNLRQHYPYGIPLKVLFIFDSRFIREFEGKDGKTADEHMNEAIGVVRNAYLDRTLKSDIGTTINVIAAKKTHPRTISSISAAGSAAAESPDDYHLYVSITYTGRGGGGRAYDIGTVCSSDKRKRSNINMAYSSGSCNAFNPPETIECTPTNRIILTAETIAHEIGHNLGMFHDFDDYAPRYTYRTHRSNSRSCRGLMDYIDDGSGWSKCSASDFSRSITHPDGSASPCIQAIGGDGDTTIDNDAKIKIIKSTNYPRNYPNNQEKNWIINFPGANAIKLEFKSFNVERGRDCRYDYLELRKGTTPTSPLHAKLCGSLNNIPNQITVAGSQLHLHFHSDDSIQQRGFEVTVTKI